MPALVFYGGYRSFLAGDDIGVFTKIALLLRLVQLIVLVAVTALTAPYEHLRNVADDLEDVCDTDSLEFTRGKIINKAYAIVVTYLVSNYVTIVSSIILEVAIARAGSLGTPVQQEARAALRPLCFLKMGPLSLLRVFNLTLGIMSVYVMHQWCSCAGKTTDYTLACPDYYQYQGWVSFILFTHFLEVGFVGAFTLFFLNKTAKRTLRLPSCVKAETKWKIFCKCCCTLSALLTCCFFGGTDNTTTDFADIGIIMADFFDDAGILDVVLSDIILGIRMVARLQNFRQRAARLELINAMRVEEGTLHDAKEGEATPRNADGMDPFTEATHTGESMAQWLCNLSEDEAGEEGSVDQHALPRQRHENLNMKRRKSLVFQIHHDSLTKQEVIRPVVRSVLSFKNPKDVLAIAEGARFITLCNGIYEFNINNLRNSFARLLCNMEESGIRATYWCCTQTERRVKESILGIPIGKGIRLARYAEEEFLKRAGLEDSAIEIEYIQFGIGLARTPYCISLDHDWKSVVVTIRGTYSLDDVVADLTIRPESMEEWGKKCNFDGTDCFVHAGMLRCSVWIYNDLESHGIVDELLEKSKHADYTLRLMGHSLGAGCAAILSFMLKDKYPTLRCHCFCVPGCTMSENMAERCKSYLTSYVFDHDIVPRMTLESMDHFRDDLLEAVARVKVTKREALLARASALEGALLHEKTQIPQSNYYKQLEKFLRHQEGLRDKRGTRDVRLYPPGEIVHLIKTTESTQQSSCCLPRNGARSDEDHEANLNGGLDYAARWGHRSDLAEIVISSHMVNDHSAPNMLKELQSTAQIFGMAAPYLVEGNVQVKATSLYVGTYRAE